MSQTQMYFFDASQSPSPAATCPEGRGGVLAQLHRVWSAAASL